MKQEDTTGTVKAPTPTKSIEERLELCLCNKIYKRIIQIILDNAWMRPADVWRVLNEKSLQHVNGYMNRLVAYGILEKFHPDERKKAVLFKVAKPDLVKLGLTKRAF